MICKFFRKVKTFCRNRTDTKNGGCRHGAHHPPTIHGNTNGFYLLINLPNSQKPAVVSTLAATSLPKAVYHRSRSAFSTKCCRCRWFC